MGENIKVQRHKEICEGLTELYRQKNHDYGDSYAETREEFPNIILVRIKDKYNRYKTLCKKGADIKVLSESRYDTLRDLANYCIMELVESSLDSEKVSDLEEFNKRFDEAMAKILEEFNNRLDESMAKIKEYEQLLKDCYWSSKPSQDFDGDIITVVASKDGTGTTELELTKKKLAEVMEENKKYREACSDDQTMAATVKGSNPPQTNKQKCAANWSDYESHAKQINSTGGDDQSKFQNPYKPYLN